MIRAECEREWRREVEGRGRPSPSVCLRNELLLTGPQFGVGWRSAARVRADRWEKTRCA